MAKIVVSKHPVPYVYSSLGWSEAGWPPQDGGQADLSDSSESSESSEPDGLDFHGMGGDDY